MDAELIIIVVLGVGVIAGLLGALYLQRRKLGDDATADEPTAPSSKAAPPAPRPPSTSAASTDAGVVTPGAEELMREGKYEEAARLAMRHKNWIEAKEYYVEAGQLGNAAHCAHRAGKLEEAADLYEQDDDLENAAKIWEKAGDHEHARELRKVLQEARKAAKTVEEVEETEDSGRHLAVPTTKQKKSYLAAMEAGEVEQAAQIAEEAGMAEEAAEAWIKVARKKRDPYSYVERIESLSPTLAHRFLELETRAHPPSDKSADLHYRLALSYARLAEPDGAIDILTRLNRVVKGYKDSEELLEGLRQCPHRYVALLSDAAVTQAASGPSIEDMLRMVDGKPCDMTNIEVFYRLGLAYLASEQWQEADDAFDKVENTSPGYRDARSRRNMLRALATR